MGFTGVKHYTESDGAADFQSVLGKNINKMFHAEMKDEANQYNTPGWVNILLVLKSYPSLIHFMDDKLRAKINKRIDEDVMVGGYLWHKGGKVLVDNFKKLCNEEEK